MLSGEQIRQARQRAGMSQAELASVVGVSPRSIGNYERGETVSRNHMPRIEEALSAFLGAGDGSSLITASDAALLAEIARRFERGGGDGARSAAPIANGPTAPQVDLEEGESARRPGELDEELPGDPEQHP